MKSPAHQHVTCTDETLQKGHALSLDQALAWRQVVQVGVSLLGVLLPVVVITAEQSQALPPDASVQYIAQAYPAYPYGDLLQFGSEGEGVTRLQQRLQSLRFYNGSIDGVYGSQTAAAVRDFQSRNRLAIDGIAGSDTQFALQNGGAFGGGGGTSTPPGGISNLDRFAYCPNPLNFSVKSYVVLIPSDNENKLSQVKRYTQSAFINRSPLGPYIQAGTCADRGTADTRVRYLRQAGFKDAQVRFF